MEKVVLNYLIYNKKIMDVIDNIRYANEKFAGHGFNAIEVTVKREGKKCLPMHLNAGGLLVALKAGVIVRFEKPGKKDTENLLEQVKLLQLSEEDAKVLINSLSQMVDEQYQENFREILLK